MSIDVRFHLGWQEFYTADRFLAARDRRTPGERIIAPLIAFTGLIVSLVLGNVWWAAGTIGLGLILLLIAPRWRQKEMRTRWAHERFHHQEHIVSFDEDGVHYKQGPTESRYPWNFYQRFLESGDAFLLICGEDVFNLIPKRAFADQREVDAFRTLASKKLKAN